MIASAKGKFIRVSSQKMRQVVDLIRGKRVAEARMILLHVNKGCTKGIGKILKSAVSNAQQKSGVDENQLYISRILSDQGPSWKRWRSAPFGRAMEIIKRTSHLTIELDLLTKTNKG